MNRYDSFALYATNLKSFGQEPQGFDEIKTMNVIVGRNNSGKSSLIDLVAQSTKSAVHVDNAHWHKNQPTRILSTTKFSQADADLFVRNTQGGPMGIHHDYGSRFIGAEIKVRWISNNGSEFISIEPKEHYPDTAPAMSYLATAANSERRNPFFGKIFFRLAAERNIVPEPDSELASITENGGGATNVIQNFINKANRPSELVEHTILAALNKIFAPDAIFSDIVCQQHGDGRWEIFPYEKGKGRISLSNSGSGLKTIILALCYIHLLPEITNNKLKDYIFAYEELENNLHPALQRRLLTYLLELARSHEFIIFLTTHSSVAIDLLNKEPDAQIIRVTHDGDLAKCRVAKAYIDNHGIMDDLDIRASDLLQANGVIWVEGPSDRVYINKWIELWSNGTISEGNHYQCVFYGGRLLSHLSGQYPRDDSSAINLLTVNRNAAILIDSDRGAVEDPINATKNRLISEFQQFKGSRG